MGEGAGRGGEGEEVKGGAKDAGWGMATQADGGCGANEGSLAACVAMKM